MDPVLMHLVINHVPIIGTILALGIVIVAMLIKNDTVKFTFDSVINSLDGVHNDHHQVVFIMTVNDITKVDESLKDRPSRFKFVREFGPPTEEVRRRILGDENLVKLSQGMSLDKVCLAADHPGTLLKSSGENLQVEMVF